MQMEFSAFSKFRLALVGIFLRKATSLGNTGSVISNSSEVSEKSRAYHSSSGRTRMPVAGCTGEMIGFPVSACLLYHHCPPGHCVVRTHCRAIGLIDMGGTRCL